MFLNHSMNKAIVRCFILFFAFSQNAIAIEVAMPILTIAGKKKADVDAAIGQPTGCEAGRQGRRCFYSKANTTVEYINNKADWITIESVTQMQRIADVLPALGLPSINPSYETIAFTKWSHVHGMLEISAIHKTSRIDYLYIKVSTP